MASRAERSRLGAGPGRRGRRVCWISEREQPLRRVLTVLGEAADSAVAEGRVFVAGKRATDANRGLLAGESVEVQVAMPRASALRVLSQHDGLVAVDKPAGIPSEPDRSGRTSLIELVASTLRERPDRLHIVNRLDAPVSGVVLVAQHRAACSAVERARGEGRLMRRYVALAPKSPACASGRWEEALVAPRSGARRGRRDPRPASTAYTVVSVVPDTRQTARPREDETRPTMLALEPLTGRTHQIRAHAARAGLPLFGDRAYGGVAVLVAQDGSVLELGRVALHALRVTLVDERGRSWQPESPIPSELRDWWAALGGDQEAWSLSLGIEL